MFFTKKFSIPKEHYKIFHTSNENLPVIMTINSSVKNFKHKEFFNWHLSVILDFNDLQNNGMPTEYEKNNSDEFFDILDLEIKSSDNGFFVVKEVWNGTHRFVWRINNPDKINLFLKGIINNNSYNREFDYHMSEDKKWEQTKYYLDLC